MRTVTWLAVGMLLLAWATDARATTVNFDDIAPNADFAPLSFTDGGLNFAVGGNWFGGVSDGASPNSNGTNNLIYSADPGTGFMTMSLAGGGNFNLQNLQMAISWFDTNPTATITANGKVLTIDQTLTTYNLDLINVTAVNISGIALGLYWTADNINYTTSITPVPEPSSWALLGIGLAAFGGATRKRR